MFNFSFNFSSAVFNQRLFFTLVFGATLVAPVLAQDAPDRPRVGLALSGGGVRGFAHVGVLKVLEEINMPIDYIAGTSMGGIIGALYASGYRADALEELVLTTDWSRFFADAPARRYLDMDAKRRDGRFIGSLPIYNRTRLVLPSGLIAGQRIAEFMARLTWQVHHIEDFTQLPIPFVCVATDIETGKAVPLRGGYLPQALRASMAVPSVFTPVKLGNQLLVDGGVARNLPAQDAHDLGADIVIGVDVSAPLRTDAEIRSFLDILDQTVGFYMQLSTEAQQRLVDHLILPEVAGYGLFDLDQTQEMIQQGEAAARRILPELKALADSLNRDAGPAPVYIAAPLDSVYVTDLRIEGLRNTPRRLVESQLDLTLPMWLTADALKDEMDRVYSTQFFERVTYQLEPMTNGTRLVIHALERQDDLLRFGFRYDPEEGPALLLNATYSNLLARGSLLLNEVRLGEHITASSEYLVGLGRRDRLGWSTRAGIHIQNYKTPATSVLPFVEFRTSVYSLESSVATYFSTTGLYGIGIREELSTIKPKVAPPDVEVEHTHLQMLHNTFWVDSIDRAVYPRRGHFLYWRNEGTTAALGSDLTFSQHRLLWRGAFPSSIDPNLSVHTGLQWGATFGDPVPVHYRFRLGGMNTSDFTLGQFVGLEVGDRTGRFMKVLSLALQAEVIKDRFLLLHANVGNTTETWNWALSEEEFEWGFGLTLGALTRIGPLEATFATSSRKESLLNINVGFRF